DAQTNVERLLNTVPDDVHGTLARRILATGSPGYKRVFGQALASGNPGSLGNHDGQILALGNTGSGGEYAVPFELDPTVILTSNGSVNPLRQIARVQPIVGKEYDLVTTAGVTVSRVAANTPATDNSPTLGQPTIKAERVQGFIPFNIEIEGDWTGMQASMMELLRDAKDIEENTAFTLGTGTSPDAGGVVTTLNVSSKVDGQAGAVLSITDPTNLENALPPRFRGNASIMGAKSIFNAYRQLFLAQAGAAGDPWNRPSQGQPAEFFGYPAHEASDMDSTVAAGKKVLLMGDFKRGFIIVDKVGMNMELVPHLTQQATAGSGVGMPTGQRGYYAWWRNNSRILIDNAFRLLVVHA
ncbi:phage major capsid protein, partial [Streptomyces sp. NPDC006333]|uniref:phage major capsid protein n=1 Tax=Streptomyces sp. NPDC006333 TaxID=3156753 RepID=UPI00339F2B01